MDSLETIKELIDMSEYAFNYRWEAAQRDKAIFQRYFEKRISLVTALELFIANNMNITGMSIDIDDWDISLDDFKQWIESLGYKNY